MSVISAAIASGGIASPSLTVTSPSSGSFTLTGYVEKTETKLKKITVEQFLKLENNELQKYLFTRLGSLIETEEKIIDNEEKYGIYITKNEVKINKQGVFYRTNALLEWIVYDKKEREVKVSKGNRRVFSKLLKENFYYTEMIEPLIHTVTKTLCKKIIEGSISTMADFVAYVRSYVVRDKTLSIPTLYKYMVSNRLDMLNVLEDPQSLKDPKQIAEQPAYIIQKLSILKYKLEDIGTVNERYDKWIGEQDKKLAEFYEQGGHLASDIAVEEPTSF